MNRKNAQTYVKISLILSPDLAAFAVGKVKRQAKETGEFTNLSKYVRDLIRQDQQAERKAIAA